MRQLDLQPPFAGTRPLAEDFEDQRRPIENLCTPRLFEIALLDRRELRIDDDNFGFMRARNGGDLLDLAAPDECRGNSPRQRHDDARDNIEPDGRGETDGLLEPRLRVAIRARAQLARLRLDVKDNRRSRRFRRAVLGVRCSAQACSAACGWASSCSWIGPSGMTVEMACL